MLTVAMKIVKTLAIQSTFEEAMIDRKRALKDIGGELGDKPPGLVEEAGIRKFIQVCLGLSTHEVHHLLTGYSAAILYRSSTFRGLTYQLQLTSFQV